MTAPIGAYRGECTDLVIGEAGCRHQISEYNQQQLCKVPEPWQAEACMACTTVVRPFRLEGKSFIKDRACVLPTWLNHGKKALTV